MRGAGRGPQGRQVPPQGPQGPKAVPYAYHQAAGVRCGGPGSRAHTRSPERPVSAASASVQPGRGSTTSTATVQMSLLILFVVLCAASGLTIPPEKKAARAGVQTEGGNARGLTISSELNNEGKSSSKFFGGLLPSFHNPNQGFFPSPMGGYNMGGFPSYPYIPPSPYGYMNGPMNYGGFYPQNHGFYGNNFGGYAATQQQQQQQQTSQIGAGGAGIGGFPSPYGG